MKDFLKFDEAALKLNVTCEELTEMRSRGDIFGYRDGTSWKFKPDEIERVASQASVLDDPQPTSDDSTLGVGCTVSDSDVSLPTSHFEEHYETYETFDEAMDNLDPTTFEKLICYLLMREGFKNVQWFGPSGHDKGRDIVCYHRRSFSNLELTDYWIVQCKHYSGSVDKRVLAEDLAKIREFDPDVYLLVVSGTLSANTKDWLENVAKQERNCRILLWERMNIHELLRQHSDLLSSILHVKVPDHSVVDQLLNRADLLGQINVKLLNTLSEPVRECIRVACETAINSCSAITTGHLLEPAIRSDKVYLRPALSNLGHCPDDVANQLRTEWLEKQSFFPVHERGVQLTGSVRIALEAASGGSITSRLHSIGLKRFLIALLMSRSSPSLAFLRNACGIDVNQLTSEIDKIPDEDYEDLVIKGMPVFDEYFSHGYVDLMVHSDSGVTLQDDTVHRLDSLRGIGLPENAFLLIQRNGIKSIADLLLIAEFGSLLRMKEVGPDTVGAIEEHFKKWVTQKSNQLK